MNKAEWKIAWRKARELRLYRFGVAEDVLHTREWVDDPLSAENLEKREHIRHFKIARKHGHFFYWGKNSWKDWKKID